MKSRLALAILLLAATSVIAHRLDEYLQGTIISIEKNRVEAQMTLTPGVAVLPTLMAEIDTDKDGIISRAEQQAYAARVLHDVSLRIDDAVLTPQLRSVKFPAIGEMKEGRGEIRIEFDAALPGGGINRKLVFENHHLSRIAAYQVNCLVPRDPDVKVVAQNRNYTQSFYELEYKQPGISAAVLPVAGKPLGAIALVLGVSVAFVWRQRRAA